MDRRVTVSLVMEEGAVAPLYASEEAAGADVRALLTHDIVLEPGKRELIPTGLRFGIPRGYEIQVRPRSGLAFKNGITVVNTPGTIDSDYRGELKILLINHSHEPFTISNGMRIAQIVIAPVHTASFVVENQLETTARGEGGFGHSGTH